MSVLVQRRVNPGRFAIAAVTAFAALALPGCGPDIPNRQYTPDSGVSVGETTGETNSRTILTSIHEGQPCIIKKNLDLTKGESAGLYENISISLTSITPENGILMASLIVSAKGEASDGRRTRYWTSLAHLNVWEGNFKEFKMGLNKGILISVKVGAISTEVVALDISVCISD